jgi:hypothetical protein
MPLQIPVLDDRNFEQLLDEAKRRIPVFTPEWTNFGGDSDPGITLIQLFAFLTDTLLYRANRIPERNRLKFLQLLGIPLQPAAPATGIVCIHNDRGPLATLPLNPGVVVTAGNVEFRTLDAVNVLPLEGQVYYKRPVGKNDPRYPRFQAKYEMIRRAQELEQLETATTADATATPVELAFYEPTLLPPPSAADPNPVVDLATTQDQMLYLALLAPTGMDPQAVRDEIANKVLSVGVAPTLAGQIKPLQPLQLTNRPAPSVSLVYELPANAQPDAATAQYRPLTPLQNPDVLEQLGVAQLPLPSAQGLQTWEFSDPLQEGVGNFPPRLEDEKIKQRLVTWLRIRPYLPGVENTPLGVGVAQLRWLGVNAARVYQAVAVVNELLGQGNGEPDQVFTLAHTPVLPNSVTLFTQNPATGEGTFWLQTDDLLAAGADDPVFSLDPEAGEIRFGDGLRGARPPDGWRLLVSYEYGGGLQGNVAIGAIKASPDERLQGGYRIENPLPTSGGDLGESAADGERRIPLALRHRDRLVTWQDFRDIAQRAPGVDVGRVEVLPLFRPSDSEQPAQDNVPGVVTLLLAPKFDAVDPLWPVPDRLFLRRVCDYLDARRLVTTEVHLRGPEYQPVYISVGIQVSGGFFPDVIKQLVTERLQLYLSALPPGGPLETGWPLQKRVLRKDLEAVVTRVGGVGYVEGLLLGAGTPVDVPEILFSGLQLPRLAGLRVTEGQPESLAALFGQVGSGAGGPTGPCGPTGPGGPIITPAPIIKTTC